MTLLLRLRLTKRILQAEPNVQIQNELKPLKEISYLKDTIINEQRKEIQLFKKHEDLKNTINEHEKESN